MDASVDHQSTLPSVSASRSKLRYPLRSTTKPREVKAVEADPAESVPTRRGRLQSSLRKSVNAPDLCSTNKANKPTRRLSVPSKLTSSTPPGTDGSITPVTGIKKTKTSNSPVSEIPKSTGKKKFTVLTSVSYWLSQIKLSEAAFNHSVSLGFFRLAKESGCEPMQRMRDELKSYTLRHDLMTELEGPAKELLQSYNILEDLERLKVSYSCSQAAPDAIENQKEVSNTVMPPKRSGDSRSRSFDSYANQDTGDTKKEKIRKFPPAGKTRASCTSAPINAGTINGNDNREKKPHNSRNGTLRVRRSTQKAVNEKVEVAAEETTEEDKENKNDHVEASQEERSQAL